MRDSVLCNRNWMLRFEVLEGDNTEVKSMCYGNNKQAGSLRDYSFIDESNNRFVVIHRLCWRQI